MGIAELAVIVLDDSDVWLEAFCELLAQAAPGASIHACRHDANAALAVGRAHAGSAVAIVDAHLDHRVDAHRDDPVDAHLDAGERAPEAVTMLAAAGIPVIVMSAHAPAPMIRSCMRAGALGVVAKSDLIASWDAVVEAALAGAIHATPELTASLLPDTEAIGALPEAHLAALRWHALGVPRPAILKEHGLDDEQFTEAVLTLVRNLRNGAHETRALG